jgi:hypothetical protein
LNFEPCPKFLAFWEIQAQYPPAFSQASFQPPQLTLVGNATIMAGIAWLVIHHHPPKDATVLQLPGFDFALSENYLEVDANTVLQLPERYTVMLVEGTGR